MKTFQIFAVFFFCFLQTTVTEARKGKIFFENGHWMKGEIQIQKDESGKELVVICMNSGSMTFKKSEIKRILYEKSSSAADQNFYIAFKNTPSKTAESKSKTPYDHLIKSASEKHQIDPELIKAVIRQESNFNFKDISVKGAQGLMQLMPDTAKGLGVQNAFDPYENIHAGTYFLRIMIENFNGDLSKALAAYNAGPGAVKKYGDIPPYKETQEYVRNVLNYYGIYRGNKAFSFRDKRGQLIFTDQPYVP